MATSNYYKSTVGSLAAHTLSQEVFPFDDGDPEGARAALRDARGKIAGAEDGEVSVWRRSAVVPSYIPTIGASEERAAEIVDLEEMKGAA